MFFFDFVSDVVGTAADALCTVVDTVTENPITSIAVGVSLGVLQGSAARCKPSGLIEIQSKATQPP